MVPLVGDGKHLGLIAMSFNQAATDKLPHAALPLSLLAGSVIGTPLVRLGHHSDQSFIAARPPPRLFAIRAQRGDADDGGRAPLTTSR